jgi:hypothetical protein
MRVTILIAEGYGISQGKLSGCRCDDFEDGCVRRVDDKLWPDDLDGDWAYQLDTTSLDSITGVSYYLAGIFAMIIGFHILVFQWVPYPVHVVNHLL